ncbi:unnamed protein product, partial [Mesorhabditis belari]|uniref:SHSP domain-containing protein n=1 Tax=Mesorhabditis belari TaxID=2138241 RepID=A0AAF3JB52_9BILA
MSQIELGKKTEEQLWDWPLHGQDGIVRVHEDGKDFEIGLDAKYFTEKEISVKVNGDRIDIDFEHEIRSDKFGTVTRKVSRCYHLPAGSDPKSIHSQLSEGILYIRGKKL